MLREIEDQLAAWPEQGADHGTVQAVQTLLCEIADQIDVDCIAVTSELDGRMLDGGIEGDGDDGGAG
jgi:hypothetical protein